MTSPPDSLKALAEEITSLSRQGARRHPMMLVNRLRCWWRGHRWQWECNIYGDEIIAAGFKRSWWRCSDCGAARLGPHLYYGEPGDTRP
jgi:hypothetical protein